MILLSIILVLGVFTTFTDLKGKKIYNQHLAIGAILGIIATFYITLFKHEDFLSHIINGLFAFLIGFLLHRFNLWRGGDAKLFSLYSFLMPPTAHNNFLFSNVISLFSCSFIIGMIILMPFFIKDIIKNHKIIKSDLFSPTKRQGLSKAIITTISFSWILTPLYSLLKITNPIIILTITYLFFNWGYTDEKIVKNHYIFEIFKKNYLKILIFIILGLSLRFWLCPNSLSYLALLKYIIMLLLTTTLSTFIHTTFYHFKDYHERVPFAPLLFIGCIISYTPFLSKLTHMVSSWNILVSR
ncbi:MAG: prepilin peptidase [Candidatus Omnitrophota bacterium]